ncbi:hypothetical protein B7R54_13015 [Subtercola boreus]|uniref:Uncharacterized protein n=1 Tax=Subtercola boreus TaxID=120213 RepID=A0A3E0VJ80_9MICO|nr:hypothetical protein [Subtercola boreus]RFA10022.1 hypothetical protein B7R54_13015 [Subtercola boreus]TQL52829.1 hypothetical protein FB464_0314 [Subtercola boreus]
MTDEPKPTTPEPTTPETTTPETTYPAQPVRPLTRWESIRHRIVTPPAIYGTLLAAALIGTAEDGESDFDILTTVVPTLLVFWLAHIFAEGIAHYGRHGQQRVTMREALRFSVGFSSGLLYGGIVPCGLLVLGAVGIMGEAEAYGFSLLAPVVLLGALGWFALADRGARWPGKLGAALVTGLLGVVVIVLKIAFH